MRVIIKRRSSTKPERIFSEILKKHHIPFDYSVIIDGKEIDFIIGNYAIEIDGHEQSSQRNAWLIKLGYVPLHYANHALRHNRAEVEKDIITKYVSLYSKTSSRSFSR